MKTLLAPAWWRGLLALVRLRQWIKNAFVFAPLVFAGEFLNFDSFFKVFCAAMLFCLASSAVYVFNDWCDIKSDRQHPQKSAGRPLAAGVISVRAALMLLGGICIVLVGGVFLMPSVSLAIGAYLLLNIAYSFTLKHIPVIDIFSIAFGFVLRVHVGALALAVPVSAWMFVTTLCLALFLAAVKRRQELAQCGSVGREVLDKYSVSLVNRYAEMSGTGALVFYGMFVMSTRPQLALSIPLVLFGLFRYWYVVEKLNGGESPTDELLADKTLLATVVVWVGVCVWVLWPGLK